MKTVGIVLAAFAVLAAAAYWELWIEAPWKVPLSACYSGDGLQRYGRRLGKLSRDDARLLNEYLARQSYDPNATVFGEPCGPKTVGEAITEQRGMQNAETDRSVKH